MRKTSISLFLGLIMSSLIGCATQPLPANHVNTCRQGWDWQTRCHNAIVQSDADMAHAKRQADKAAGASAQPYRMTRDF